MSLSARRTYEARGGVGPPSRTNAYPANGLGYQHRQSMCAARLAAPTRLNYKSLDGRMIRRSRLNEKREMNRSKIVRTTLVGKSNSISDCGMRIVDCRTGRNRFGSARHVAFCILHFAFCNFLTSPVECQAAELPSVREWVTENLSTLVDFYRQLHQTPELSLKEEKTAARMAEELRTLGIQVTTGIGGHGVVGVLENGPGKVLMLRADMDAFRWRSKPICRMRQKSGHRTPAARRWR